MSATILLAAVTLLGFALGFRIQDGALTAPIAKRWWGTGAALAMGVAAWTPSALLDPLAGTGMAELHWLRFVSLALVVMAFLAGLPLAGRGRSSARFCAGLLIAGAIVSSTWLNAVPFAGVATDHVEPLRLAAVAGILFAAVLAGTMLYHAGHGSGLARVAAPILFTGGCLFAAIAVTGGFPPHSISVANGAEACAAMLIGCVYASSLLLVLIERDARRETSDLSASLLSANEDILQFEQRDPVTLLHHRAHFAHRMESVFESVARRRGIAAVAVFGVDGLALINDAYGPTAGDEALRVVAGRLLARVRDERAGRLGGSEFAAVLTRFHDVGELMVEVSALLDALGQPIMVGEELVHISMCAGLAIYPCDGEGTQPLTRAAHAMHRARRSGRNQVCVFDAALDCAFDRDLSVQTGLHRALANREFVLYLQPKCDVRNGAIVGAEALLRWDSPLDGLIAPTDFIGVAERYGLIKDIGWFVIEEACRLLRRLRDAGILLPLSVNLAPGQFVDPGLIQRLCETLARYGVSPGSLHLEITESMAVENPEHMSAVLSALRALGFRVAMDDFGTGYSSLSKLVSIPVDELKLDRSFIVDIENNTRSRSIVQAVIELAHACGCVVVVEGVETRGQAALIGQFGADQAQGFYWHRPMPFAAFVETVESAAQGGKVALFAVA